MSEFKAADFKLKLMRFVAKKINESYRSEKEATYYLKSNRATMNFIMNNKAGNCSTSKLVAMLNIMGYRTEIKITRIGK